MTEPIWLESQMRRVQTGPVVVASLVSLGLIGSLVLTGQWEVAVVLAVFALCALVAFRRAIRSTLEDVGRSCQELVLLAERAMRGEAANSAHPVPIRELEEVRHRLVAAATAHSSLRNRAGQSIKKALTTDSATGLLNRRGFRESLDDLTKQHAEISMIRIAVRGVDLVTHSYGMNVGDMAMYHLGLRIRMATNPSDTIARFGAGEFVVISNADASVAELATRLVRKLNEPLALTEPATGTARAEATAGWTCGRADGKGELLRQSALALANAEKSPTRVGSYDPEVAAAFEAHRRMKDDLVRALEEEQFVLYGQTVLDVLEQRVACIEVLLRWEHPSGKLLNADEFLGAAADAGLMAAIDRWVILSAAQFALCADPTTAVGLNVSNEYLTDPEMPNYVQSVLRTTGLAPGRIQIDVTETDIHTDVSSAVASINRLNTMGIKIALDDFGTGFATLSQLLQLAVSTIKIDREMTQLVEDPEGRAVIAGIIAFANERNLQVIAEGVETADQSTALALLGCRQQQGYLHDRPVPLQDLVYANRDVIETTAADDVREPPADGTGTLEPAEFATPKETETPAPLFDEAPLVLL